MKIIWFDVLLNERTNETTLFSSDSSNRHAILIRSRFARRNVTLNIDIENVTTNLTYTISI